MSNQKGVARWLFGAALFAASGFLTYELYASGEQSSRPHDLFTDAWYELRTGLPFGIVTAALWARPIAWIVPIVLLDCGAWFAAYYVAIGLWARVGAYPAMAAAGFVGAFLVVLFTGLGCRKLWSLKPLFEVALVGAVAGIPFALLSSGSSTPNLTVLAWTFPLWQVAVGAWMRVSTLSTGG